MQNLIFLGGILGVAGTAIQAGRTPEQALSLIFGMCFLGVFVNVILSRFLHLLSKIVTSIVSGTRVMLIGLSLLKTGITSLAGGTAALQNNTFANAQNIALGGSVFLIVIILTLSKIIASENLDRRATIIIAVSLVLRLRVVFVPELFNNQPVIVKNMFASATSTGGLTAILLRWLLPPNPTPADSAVSADGEITDI